MKEIKVNRFTSLLIVLLAYVLALLIGYWVITFQVGDIYMTVLIADIAATIIIFSFSFFLKNSSMYDPYWTVIPPFIVLYLMQVYPEGNHLRQIFFLIAVSVWAIRLTLNWVRSWLGLEHEDWRYKDLANKTGKMYWLVSFSGIHLFPTLIVFLGCLPAFYVIKKDSAIGVFDFLGLIVSVAAAIIQLISDEQMRNFKKKAQKGGIMQSGLWKFSRHPNYFGEILFWFGLFIFCLPISISEWWTVIGWISMILLFVFISVPMMDERSLNNKPGFKEYMKKSSALFPSLKLFRNK
ncbi:MAG: DUF1295 domain-containing protein [Bacteroidota bacterium]